MGYLFTLIYLLTAYLTPPVLFGPLTEYHVEIVVAILALLASLPKFGGSGLLRAPQTLALLGMSLAISASIAQSGWLGGIFAPLYGFLQPAFAFLLVAVNCRRKWHFSLIIVTLFLGSVFFMYMGIHDLQANVIPSEYLYGDGTLRRLRGLGFVHDPNDFAQILVSLVPCVFLWRKRSLGIDILLLGLPIAILLIAMYYTHSRGAMLALTAIVLFSARRKIGIVPAIILAILLVAALFSIGWSGGRDISMDSGADRLDLWYDGIEALKAHPLFGMGLGNFAGTFGLTAHNSLVICFAELGVVGLSFWMLLIVSSMRTAIRYAGTSIKQFAADTTSENSAALSGDRIANAEGEIGTPSQTKSPFEDETWFGVMVQNNSSVSPKQVLEGQEILRLLPIALIGMLTAGWFISRTFSIFLFMYFGMVYAAQRMTGPSPEIPEERLSLVLKWSALATAAALLTLFVIMRARNIFAH